ncbi:hypothetical protein GCM10007977_051020 [Dactylosporangium sucinum]|uniref:Uncharacterized protein n=1 Tax=Dactylosporangium sucinum TaxID=1424081 RepID=A0A917TY17_9ACTN|nr:hypothetical protein GCM10007977_051020 [Dactylosporangium sucinum]
MPAERIRATLKQRIADTAPATGTDPIRRIHAFFGNRTGEPGSTRVTGNVSDHGPITSGRFSG